MIDQERTRGLFRKLDLLLAKSKARPLPERVHQIRTTARRLESVLEILYPEPTARVGKLSRGLKRLRRAAGEVRDIDVQIAALRTLKIGREAERKARLMHALGEQRAERERQLLAALQNRRVRKLRRRMQRTAAEIEASMAPAGEVGVPQPAPAWLDFDPLATALRKFATLARKTKSLNADTLHGFRTACKRVRYVAETGGSAGEGKHIVDLLKRIQDSAGDWHDWATLTATAERVFTHDGALTAALRNVTQAKFHESLGVVSGTKRELLAMYRQMLAHRRELEKARKSNAREELNTAVGAA